MLVIERSMSPSESELMLVCLMYYSAMLSCICLLFWYKLN
uniref:Uncharacterized protein n=1 Tax=Rhizophora mucronata TaxID=61149 RepID=A0A2P2P2C9_RHIMU